MQVPGMIIINTKPTWRSVALLATLSLLAFLAGLCVYEVRLSDEALIAAFAEELSQHGRVFRTVVFGREVPGFPLYSWFVSLCSLFSAPGNFSLRLPAVASILLLALLSGLFARRIQSSFAGIIAASMVLTSVFSFRVGIRAHNDIMVAALLAGAWYFVYSFGWRRQMWWLGWGVAVSLVFLASFGAGAKALIIFYLPFFFMGRRLRSAEAIQSKQHLVCCAFLVAAIVFWLAMTPGQPFMPWSSMAFVQPGENYLVHLSLMLPKTLLYMLPWTFIAWSPFCLALTQFEADSRACRFLRAIVLTNFFMFWLMPGGSPLHLLPVFGPMAGLVGVYSEIVFRRYHDFFARLAGMCVVAGFAASILCFIFWLGVNLKVIELVDFSGVTVLFSMFSSVLAGAVFGALMFSVKFRINLRTYLLLATFGVAILYFGTAGVLHSWKCMYHEVNGLRLADVPVEKEGGEAGQTSAATAETTESAALEASALQAESKCAEENASNIFNFLRKTKLRRRMELGGIKVIYADLPSISSITSLLAEAYYMQCHIEMFDRLPDGSSEPVVYCLSRYAPADTSRNWTSLGGTVPLGLRTGRLSWKLQREEFSWSRRIPLVRVEMGFEDSSVSLIDEVSEMRLYRGEARPETNEAPQGGK